MCENDSSNWDKYINQALTSYNVTPNIATAEHYFSLSMEKTPIYH